MSTICGSDNSKIVDILSKMNESFSSLDFYNIGNDISNNTATFKEGWLAPEQIEIYENYSQTHDEVDDVFKINEATKWKRLSNHKETDYFEQHEAHQFYIRIPKSFKIYNFKPLNNYDYDIPIYLETASNNNPDYNIYVCYIYGDNIGEENSKYPDKLIYSFTNWFKIYIVNETNDDNFYTNQKKGIVTAGYGSYENEWNSETWYRYRMSRISNDIVEGNLYDWLNNNIQNLDYSIEKLNFNSSNEYEYIAVCFNKKSFRYSYPQVNTNSIIHCLDYKFICTDDNYSYYLFKLSSETFADDNTRVYNFNYFSFNGYLKGYCQRNIYINKKIESYDVKAIVYQDISNGIINPTSRFTSEEIKILSENTKIDFDNLPTENFPFLGGTFYEAHNNKYSVLKLPKNIKLVNNNTTQTVVTIKREDKLTVSATLEPIYESDKFCYYKTYLSVSSGAGSVITISSSLNCYELM